MRSPHHSITLHTFSHTLAPTCTFMRMPCTHTRSFSAAHSPTSDIHNHTCTPAQTPAMLTPQQLTFTITHAPLHTHTLPHSPLVTLMYPPWISGLTHVRPQESRSQRGTPYLPPLSRLPHPPSFPIAHPHTWIPESHNHTCTHTPAHFHSHALSTLGAYTWAPLHHPNHNSHLTYTPNSFTQTHVHTHSLPHAPTVSRIH